MGKVMAGMTVSLDGFMNDRNGSAQSLSPDFDELMESVSFKQMTDDTGAIIMGNTTYHMADPFSWVNEDYEYQLPLFILTHDTDAKVPKGNDTLSVTLVANIEEAIRKAKAAAGDKMVQIIGGADTIQQALNSGLVDELGIDVMPVLLGGGLRLFENLDTDSLQLERISVEKPTPMRTSITYKVTKIS